MDIDRYKSEVDRLEKEVLELSKEVQQDGKAPSAPMSIGKYKKYIFVVVGMIAFLFLIKPKFVLKIDMIDGEHPVIALDKGKLIMWWFILSAIGCIAIYMWPRLTGKKCDTVCSS